MCITMWIAERFSIITCYSDVTVMVVSLLDADDIKVHFVGLKLINKDIKRTLSLD